MRYPTSEAAEDLMQNLHLRILNCKFVSLLGRSGVGKTTLLRMIAGFETHYTGQITIDDVPIRRPSLSVQMLFQDSRLLPWKTVFENVAFATQDPTGQTTRLKALAWLKRVGLSDRQDFWPKNLSGGQAARVAIARALVVQPRVLLLDEPFGNLDLMTRLEVQDEFLRDLAVTQPIVLLVSHSIDDVVFLSDEIHVLASRPAGIAKTFTVPVPRPRYRGHRELSRISEEISQYLNGDSRDTVSVSGATDLDGNHMKDCG